jgi:hypothetical protein
LKAIVIVVAALAIHFSIRKFIARRMARKLETDSLAGNMQSAFLRNTRTIRSLFHPAPAGWTSRSKRILATVIADASQFVQTMNDRFTNPSGVIEESPQAEMLKVVEKKDQPEAEPEHVEAVADKTS